MTIEAEEFEAWLYSEESPVNPNGLKSEEIEVVFIAWQAARAIDAKRIVELEAWANRPVTDNTQLIANMEAQITDLEAQNKAMREALSGIAIQGNFQMNDDKEQLYVEVSKTYIRKAIKVLALDKKG